MTIYQQSTFRRSGIIQDTDELYTDKVNGQILEDCSRSIYRQWMVYDCSPDQVGARLPLGPLLIVAIFSPFQSWGIAPEVFQAVELAGLGFKQMNNDIGIID